MRSMRTLQIRRTATELSVARRSFSMSALNRVSHLDTEKPQRTSLRGKALLNNPTFNKGTAFSKEERKEFGLDGLLPSAVDTLEEQVQRAYEQYRALNSDILRNSFMTSMHDQNQVLFYKLFQEHLKEMMPIVYTPTTGEAISNYSRLFRRPEGCFLSIDNTSEEIDARLAIWGQGSDVDYIICSDSEAILGIGDQGVGGIGISIAKLALMTLCGGLHPNKALPIVLDVGTNNQTLLNDDLYLGLRRERVTGKEYDAFLDRFVKAVMKRFPSATLHFEDFGTKNARTLLDRYKDDFCVFNDDSQGTSAVTLAALTAGVWVTKSKLRDQKVVLFGAGTAGVGIADRIRDAMVTEGLSEEEALSRIYLLDRPGLLLESHAEPSSKFQMSKFQRPYAKKDADFDSRGPGSGVGLLEVIETVRPEILIGCSGQQGAFTEEVIRAMAKHVDRPIVLPLSNPTRLIEAVPADVNAWTDGRALIATGSPFRPVLHKDVEYEIAESNNALCFPGIGYGCVLARARRLSDGMIIAAASALASCSPALRDPDKALLPDMRQVRETSVVVAAAVIRAAVAEGLDGNPDLPAVFSSSSSSYTSDDQRNKGEEKGGQEERLGWVRRHMWAAEYRPLEAVEHHTASASERGQTGVGAKH